MSRNSSNSTVECGGTLRNWLLVNNCIPAFDRNGHLERAIANVLSQTYVNSEPAGSDNVCADKPERNSGLGARFGFHALAVCTNDPTIGSQSGRILKIDPVASLSKPTNEHVQCGATGSTLQKTEIGPDK